jgi:hypothetical protein
MFPSVLFQLRRLLFHPLSNPAAPLPNKNNCFGSSLHQRNDSSSLYGQHCLADNEDCLSDKIVELACGAPR